MKAFFILFVMLLTVMCAVAQDVEPQDTPEEPKLSRAERIGQGYEISGDSVNALKSNYKVGYGGIEIALKMAAQSGKSVEEILAMKKDEKKGWGVIAKELGLKKSNSDMSDDAIEKRSAKSHKNRAAQKEVKADRKAKRQEQKAEKRQQKADRKAERKAKKQGK